MSFILEGFCDMDYVRHNGLKEHKWKMSLPRTLFSLLIKQELELYSSFYHGGEVQVSCKILLLVSYLKLGKFNNFPSLPLPMKMFPSL